MFLRVLLPDHQGVPDHGPLNRPCLHGTLVDLHDCTLLHTERLREKFYSVHLRIALAEMQTLLLAST